MSWRVSDRKRNREERKGGKEVGLGKRRKG